MASRYMCSSRRFAARMHARCIAFGLLAVLAHPALGQQSAQIPACAPPPSNNVRPSLSRHMRMVFCLTTLLPSADVVTVSLVPNAE